MKGSTFEDQDIYQALENAAADLFGFAVVTADGVAMLGEKELLDVLLLGLENTWFTKNFKEKLTHEEFRHEFFTAIWRRGRGVKVRNQVGVDTPLGHEEMLFYKLPRLSRAALYLRAKKKFTVQEIAQILEVNAEDVREDLERAREYMLGRRVFNVEMIEEDF